MIEIERINSHHEHYPFMEELMQAAFPLQERRDSVLQREYADNRASFHNNVLLEGNTPIGLLTYWDFGSFLYVEHFAISNALRNRGYGQQALERLKEVWQGMIVLEVEEPTDEITRRRIGFYQRQGFTLKAYPYQQPPYREGDDWFPMKLMTLRAEEFSPATHELVKKTLYKQVYGIK